MGIHVPRIAVTSASQTGLAEEPLADPRLSNLRPQCGKILLNKRRLVFAQLAFEQYWNRQKETERPAQDQQYKQIAISLRGNREPRHVGHEKTEKAKGKSSHPWRKIRRSSHDSPEMPKKRNCKPSHHKKTGNTQLNCDLAQPAFRSPSHFPFHLLLT